MSNGRERTDDKKGREQPLRCPLCGSDAVRAWDGLVKQGVLCENCGCNAPTLGIWNTRWAPPSAEGSLAGTKYLPAFYYCQDCHAYMREPCAIDGCPIPTKASPSSELSTAVPQAVTPDRVGLDTPRAASSGMPPADAAVSHEQPSFAVRVRPAVAAWVRKCDRSVMNPALPRHYGPLLQSEAAKARALLEEIDSMIGGDKPYLNCAGGKCPNTDGCIVTGCRTRAAMMGDAPASAKLSSDDKGSA